MGVDYSYECTKVEVVREIGIFHGKTVLLCDLDFVDEHDHKLATNKRVPVVVEDGHAEILKYPENLLPEDGPQLADHEWKVFEKLCKYAPSYGVYNDKEFSAMVAAATSGSPTQETPMTNARMIRLLQMFFDGTVDGWEDVVGLTGVKAKDAVEVYEAIKKLRAMPFEQIEALDK